MGTEWARVAAMTSDSGEAAPDDLEPELVENLGEGLAASLNLVPVAGGALSDVAAGIIRRRQNRRLRGFLADLVADLDRVKDRLDRDYMESEDFHDLAEEILSNAADTRQQERLDAYRALFVNSVTQEDVGFDEAAEVSTLIARWLPSHIEFLAALTERERWVTRGPRNTGHKFRVRVHEEEYELPDTTVRNRGIERIARRLDWNPQRVRRVWQELYASGVVSLYVEKKENREGVVDQYEAYFYLTEFGDRVLELLENPAASDDGS